MSAYNESMDISRFFQPAPQSGPAVKVIYNSTNSEFPGQNFSAAGTEPLTEPMRTPPPSPHFTELTTAPISANARQSSHLMEGQQGLFGYWSTFSVPQYNNSSCLNITDWDEIQVIDWVQSCIKKFNLNILEVNLEKFKITGCDLCSKHMADFVDYAGPRAGKILYGALLQLGAINQEKSDFNEATCFDNPKVWTSNFSVLPMEEEPLDTLGDFSMIGIEVDMNALDNASTANNVDLVDYINSEDDCSTAPTSPNSSVSIEVPDILSVNTVNNLQSSNLVSNELTKMFQIGKQPRKGSFNSGEDTDSDDSIAGGVKLTKFQARNAPTNRKYLGKKTPPLAHGGARPRGRPRKPKPEPISEDEEWEHHNRRKHNMKGNHLWEFIRDLLKNPSFNPRHIKWEDKETGVFRIVNSENIARAWGKKKNNPSMTYEKLSRAMRYYYRRSILDRVDGRRLVYKFGKNASGWQ